MASTANSASAANRASGNNLNPSSQNAGGARQSLRTNASLKGDANRRQSASPGDGGPRRSTSQKAWTQGYNPLLQKPSSLQNGSNVQSKSTPSPKPSSPKESASDRHAHDRLRFLLTSFTGLPATIITKSGEKFSGVFSSSTLQPNGSTVLLKMVQRVANQREPHANGLSDVTTPFIGSAADHSMKFNVEEIDDIIVNNVTTSEVVAKESNGAQSSFRTDTDISGGLAMRERNLQRWEPAATDPSLDMSLEDSGTAGWDQFEANERLFGATTNYDENIYTTRINRNDPLYKRKEAEAARIAREIEGTATDNPHMREERGHTVEGEGLDEEEKYSGVRRGDAGYLPLQTGQPNKYTPPARRQPAAQQPVTASPLTADPAIISAQLADPNAASKVPVPSKPAIASDVAAEKQPAPSQPGVSEHKAPVPSLANVPLKRPGVAENATSNVETEVLDHFRQFANNEKLRMQERRRNQASHDRTVKLNELMKFSQNFKLATPVPKDLVPILAKDPSKQEEIIERAQRQADEKAAAKTVPQVVPAAEQKPSAARTTAPRHETGMATVPPSAPADRQNHHRGRQVYPPQGPHFALGGRGPAQNFHGGGRGTLSTRLADNFRQQKNALGPVPAPLPIHEARAPPSGPSGDIVTKSQSQTPTITKFNVRAMEFKPNPAASTFTPGGAGNTGATASPQLSSRGRSVSRTSTPSAFFGSKKPLSAAERPSLKDQCSPMARLKKEAEEQKDKDFTFNGGIPPAYRTAPTWDVAPGNEEKTFRDMFKSPLPAISPQSRSVSSSHIPHPSQLPFHGQQNTPNLHPAGGPMHGPPHLHQQHPNSHFDDPHRMQLSASTSHMFPSPRLQHAYPSPMAPHAQLAYGQPVPQFYVNQGGSQPNHMRQYPGGPQFINPQNGMAAPMMVQQPSGGPYMGVPQGMNGHYNPQMQMYSPNPSYAYPQHSGPPPQPHSGYPSPSRGAPMMMHQGSQPGQPPQPVMFMNSGQQAQPVYAPQQPGHAPHRGYPQPQYSSGSHQSQHYPPHQHRGPGNNYSPIQHVSPQMPGQQSSATAAVPPPAEASDDAK